MRKSAIVIGFGAFFLTMALLLKFYAYDKLAVIPIDQNTEQTAVDKNAYIFDAGTLKFQRTTLTTTVTAVVDKDASKKHGDNVAIFDKWQFSRIPQTKEAQQAYVEKITVNRHTGKVVHCCDEAENGKPVEHEGYTVKFPFGTEKTTYQYWDPAVEKAVPLTYAGTDKINGLEVYRFEGTVPRQTMISEKTTETPGFVFGNGASSTKVDAARSYANKRTIWVEPQTGAFIKVSEGQQQWLTDPKTDKSVLVLKTTSVFNDATVKSNVDEYKGKASQLKALKIAPWVLGILGLILLVGGLVMLAVLGRGRANRKDDGAAAYHQGDDRGGDSDPTQYESEYRGDGATAVADDGYADSVSGGSTAAESRRTRREQTD